VRYHLAGNILDEVRAKKNTFGRHSHKIILGNNSLIIEEYIPACFWTNFVKMTPEETDFERNNFVLHKIHEQQARRARPFG